MKNLEFTSKIKGGIGKTDLYLLKLTENHLYLVKAKTLSKTLIALLKGVPFPLNLLGMLINAPFQYHTINKLRKYINMSNQELDEHIKTDAKSYKYAYQEIEEIQYGYFKVDLKNSDSSSSYFKFKFDSLDIEFPVTIKTDNKDWNEINKDIDKAIQLVQSKSTNPSIKEIKKLIT